MFHGLLFCGIDLPPEDANTLKVAIDKEGGVLRLEMDDDVTHFVTNKVGSKAFFIAREKRLTIIPPKWVYDSINQGSLTDIGNYRFSLFQGMVVTTTGFDLHERYSIQSALVTNGGIFERQMIKDHTDYLIVRNTASEKYQTSLQWNIITVNEYWISDCLRNNVLQNPIDYQNFELMSNSSVLDTAASQSVPLSDPSYTQSCLSKITPLDNAYLTPNTTIVRTREVDKLLDGFIVYLSIHDIVLRKRINSILTCHSAFCVDYLMPSTTLIVADTLTDFQNTVECIRHMESALTPHFGLSITEFTQNTNDINLLYIPVVNREWVLDTHTRYSICDYESYLWKNGIFSNLTFYLSDFKRDKDVVSKCIEANDGQVIDDMKKAVYVVCPRTVDSDVYLDERAVSVKWLRACVDRKRLIPRTDFVLYRPFPSLLKSKTVCLTGFGYEDRVSMESYIVALGGKLENTVNSSTFALICQDQTEYNVKIKEAEQYGVFIVKRDWIDWLIVHKEFVEATSYLYQYSKKQKEVSQPPKDSENYMTEIVTVSADVKPSRFVIDGRSNSIPDLTDPTTDGSVVGSNEKSEVLFTSFNEIMDLQQGADSANSVSLDREKHIHEASQGILSPTATRPLPFISSSQLNEIVSGSAVKPRSLPMLGVSKRPKIDLDMISDEESEIPTVQRSLVVLQEDLQEPRSKKTRGRGRGRGRGKTGSRSKTKTTSSRKK